MPGELKPMRDELARLYTLTEEARQLLLDAKLSPDGIEKWCQRRELWFQYHDQLTDARRTGTPEKAPEVPTLSTEAMSILTCPTCGGPDFRAIPATHRRDCDGECGQGVTFDEDGLCVQCGATTTLVDLADAAALPEGPSEGAKPWVIVAAHLSTEGVAYFWGPKFSGYTRDLSKAGRYTEDEAKRREKWTERMEVAVSLEEAESVQHPAVSDDDAHRWFRRRFPGGKPDAARSLPESGTPAPTCRECGDEPMHGTELTGGLCDVCGPAGEREP